MCPDLRRFSRRVQGVGTGSVGATASLVAGMPPGQSREIQLLVPSFDGFGSASRTRVEGESNPYVPVVWCARRERGGRAGARRARHHRAVSYPVPRRPRRAPGPRCPRQGADGLGEDARLCAADRRARLGQGAGPGGARARADSRARAPGDRGARAARQAEGHPRGCRLRRRPGRAAGEAPARRPRRRPPLAASTTSSSDA